MISIADILTEKNIILETNAKSKKRVFERISEICAAQTQLDTELFYHCLIHREHLGSTGVGEGVALPHSRLPKLKTPVGCFLQLKSGVDFDAPDKKPVDLVFGFFVPENATEEHLNLLSQIAEIFNQTDNRNYFRDSHSPREVFLRLTQPHEKRNIS